MTSIKGQTEKVDKNRGGGRGGDQEPRCHFDRAPEKLSRDGSTWQRDEHLSSTPSSSPYCKVAEVTEVKEGDV